jgi:hypothetical protein
MPLLSLSWLRKQSACLASRRPRVKTPVPMQKNKNKKNSQPTKTLPQNPEHIHKETEVF